MSSNHTEKRKKVIHLDLIECDFDIGNSLKANKKKTILIHSV